MRMSQSSDLFCRDREFRVRVGGKILIGISPANVVVHTLFEIDGRSISSVTLHDNEMTIHSCAI